jgi:hypothetical protein
MYERYYVDNAGYVRDSADGRLVHRTIAYYHIYLKHRKKYPYRFRYYIVHHKDKNKLNNRVNNLMVLTPKEHKKYHKHLR